MKVSIQDNIKIYSKPGATAILRNNGKNEDVLYFDSDVLITNTNGYPSTLGAFSNFDPFKLPDSLQEKIFNVKTIFLNFSPSAKNDDIDTNSTGIKHSLPMPLWLDKFNNLQFLKLENLKIGSLLLLQNAPLKYLIFKNVVIEEKLNTIDQIGQLKSLEYIVHDNIFTEEEVVSLKKNLPTTAILLEEDYYLKLKRGEIKL